LRPYPPPVAQDVSRGEVGGAAPHGAGPAQLSESLLQDRRKFLFVGQQRVYRQLQVAGACRPEPFSIPCWQRALVGRNVQGWVAIEAGQFRNVNLYLLLVKSDDFLGGKKDALAKIFFRASD